MEEKLNLILSEIKEMKSELKQVNVRLDKLEEGQTRLEKKIDDNFQVLNNQNLTLLSGVQAVNKKLDRQSAVSRSSSAKLRELEIRVEDLEFSPPVK